MDVKLASSEAALADRSSAAERRDLASAAADRSVFVTAAPWRAQALRGIGFATGTLTLLWLVALIAGAVGAGRLPAVPFPAIGHLGDAPAAQVPRKAAHQSLPSGSVARGPAAVDRGSRVGSPGHAAPAPAGTRGGARDHHGSGVSPTGLRHQTAGAPSSGSAQRAPGPPQPHAATPSPAPSAPSQPSTSGAPPTTARPVAPPGRQTAASKAPVTSRSASPPTTTPGTVHRPTTTG